MLQNACVMVYDLLNAAVLFQRLLPPNSLLILN